MRDLSSGAGREDAAPAMEADAFAMERRLYLLTCASAATAVLISLPLAPWRVTTGLLLGGLLSILNYRWLRASVGAAFAAGSKMQISRYLLRYFVIALVIVSASWLQVISPVAALVGLCSFVAALMIEGLAQIFLTIIRRED